MCTELLTIIAWKWDDVVKNCAKATTDISTRRYEVCISQQCQIPFMLESISVSDDMKRDLNEPK